jgi:hypothetical protein
MVDNAVLNRKQLERLARKISEKTTPERIASGRTASGKTIRNKKDGEL